MLLQVLLDVVLLRLRLLPRLHRQQEEAGPAAGQGGDFGDLREVHAQLLDDAGIEDELARLEALAGLVVVAVQQGEGRLQLLAELLVCAGELEAFAVEQVGLLGHKDDKTMP